ncbi:hypothetical protein ACIPYR_15790 [Streptomyces parvus]|uniref:hypothetical protein n=1 Tax=Streptomyces TaxID=1883 RepID=UPI00382E0840
MHLETVLHLLPRKSARELRALVRVLDARILMRAKIIPAAGPDEHWWLGRFQAGPGGSGRAGRVSDR